MQPEAVWHLAASWLGSAGNIAEVLASTEKTRGSGWPFNCGFLQALGICSLAPLKGPSS